MGGPNEATPDTAPTAQPYQAAVEDIEKLQVVCKESADHKLTGLFVISRPEGPLKPESGDEAAKPGQFSLGIVATDGLVLVLGSTNPWLFIFGETALHAMPFSRGQKYRGCLFRHANGDLARAFVEYLNTGKDTHGHGFAKWSKSGSVEELTKELEIKQVEKNEGVQQVLEVPEDPKAFLPPGPKLYGGWTLYRDMPNASCAKVSEQVELLQCHLGALRYPIGQQELPYWPQPPDPGDAKAYFNKGIFDARTQAAFVRFQQHAAEPAAAKLLDRERTMDVHVDPKSPFAAKKSRGNSWAYVCVEEPTKDELGKLEGHTLGVMDALSEAAISRWLEKGLRKPGKILLGVDIQRPGQGGIWLREEAAIAFETWRRLAIVFGVEYGLRSGHTFRNILDLGHGGGKRLNSIHKTGLAVDLSHNGKTRRPNSDFPIRFEGQWIKDDKELRDARKKLAQLEAKQRKAEGRVEQEKKRKNPTKVAALEKDVVAAREAVKKQWDEIVAISFRHIQDQSGAKVHWRLKWRLYGHSTRNVSWWSSLGIDDTDVKTLVSEIQKVELTMTNWFRKTLGIDAKATKIGEASGTDSFHVAADQWIANAVETAAKARRTLLAYVKPDDEHEFVDHFFRTEVRQWLFHPYEADGGTTSDRASAPKDGDGDYPPPSYTAVSFVNLSALAAACGMARIGATRNGSWKDPSSREGRPVMKKFTVRKTFGDLVELVEKARSLRSVHANETFPITPAKRGASPIELRLDKLDLDFMKRWGKAHPTLRPKKKAGGIEVIKTEAPQLTLVLNAIPDGEKLLEPVLSKLKSDFANDSFLVVLAGARTALPEGISMKGSAIHEVLKVAIEMFKAEFEALKKIKDAGKAKTTKSRRKDWSEWTVTLQPIFHPVVAGGAVGFQPSDVVDFWAPGDPSALEWWHYQHTAARGERWGDLLEEVGFAEVILSAPVKPTEKDQPYAYGAGVGYAPVNFGDETGGVDTDDVENWPIGDYVPPGG